MVIPDCNDGEMKVLRGKAGGICDRDNGIGCSTKLYIFRECNDSNLLNRTDIYMSDDDNKCYSLIKEAHSHQQ